MCGVAGIYNYRDPERPVDEALLVRMTRLLQHRGPDAEGFFVSGPLGLGHRRLAIVDLSATGRQPMASPDGTRWLSYNGEIYNHLELRRRLEGRGRSFRGPCDSETLLELLCEGGPQALEEAAGIYAFAFWDARVRRLILARDPLGVKQLYYYDDGERIVFASEIKAVLACHDVPRDIDYEAVNQYLHFHAPLFERTFFRAIKQLRPAEFMEVARTGPSSRVFWHLDGFAPRRGSDADNVAELRSLLAHVVRQQTVADVPIGAFLSGGIDSSAIAAFARAAGKPITCFGVHFDHKDIVDERPYQEATAAALGLPLQLVSIDPATLPDDMAKVMYMQDQPVIGPAMLPMYQVSQLAARQVKVCLGGQAADELFAGYARYALAHPISAIRPRRRATSRVHGSLFKQLVIGRNMRRLLRSAATSGSVNARYFNTFAVVEEGLWHALADDRSWISRRRARQIFDDTLALSPARDVGDRLLHWDVQTYLPALFQQEDRMSMACSLESRVPFADPRLARFAFHTAFGLKLRDGCTKWILRQAVADVLPEQVLSRRKVGFDSPVPAWLRGPHRDYVRDTLLSQRARERGLWRAEPVDAMLRQSHHPRWFDVVWKLLSIEQWARLFVDGRCGAQEDDAHVAARRLARSP